MNEWLEWLSFWRLLESPWLFSCRTWPRNCVTSLHKQCGQGDWRHQSRGKLLFLWMQLWSQIIWFLNVFKGLKVMGVATFTEVVVDVPFKPFFIPGKMQFSMECGFRLQHYKLTQMFVGRPVCSCKFIFWRHQSDKRSDLVERTLMLFRRSFQFVIVVTFWLLNSYMSVYSSLCAWHKVRSVRNFSTMTHSRTDISDFWAYFCRRAGGTQ